MGNKGSVYTLCIYDGASGNISHKNLISSFLAPIVVSICIQGTATLFNDRGATAHIDDINIVFLSSEIFETTNKTSRPSPPISGGARVGRLA